MKYWGGKKKQTSTQNYNHRLLNQLILPTSHPEKGRLKSKVNIKQGIALSEGTH